jgi:alpha-tubulin suppressor-like RCC1 family protein
MHGLQKQVTASASKQSNQLDAVPEAGAGAVSESRLEEVIALVQKDIEAYERKIEASKQGRRVLAWGKGTHGQLGLGHTQDMLHPTPIAKLTTSCVQLACGTNFVTALSADGKVFAWGNGAQGQLGNGSNTSSHEPLLLEALAAFHITAIASGAQHSLAIGVQRKLNRKYKSHPATASLVFGWGSNMQGQLACSGIEGEGSIRSSPTELEHLRDFCIEKIACGSQHSLALARYGVQTFLYSFGNNTFGQLGTRTFQHSSRPMTVNDLKNKQVANIDAGAWHSIAITANGEIYCWGMCETASKIGADNKIHPAPFQVISSKPTSNVYMDISAGQFHTMAIAHNIAPFKVGRFNGILPSQEVKLTTSSHAPIRKTAAITNSQKTKKQERTVFCCRSGRSTKAISPLVWACHALHLSPLCQSCARTLRSDGFHLSPEPLLDLDSVEMNSIIICEYGLMNGKGARKHEKAIPPPQIPAFDQGQVD